MVVASGGGGVSGPAPGRVQVGGGAGGSGGASDGPATGGEGPRRIGRVVERGPGPAGALQGASGV